MKFFIHDRFRFGSHVSSLADFSIRKIALFQKTKVTDEKNNATKKR